MRPFLVCNCHLPYQVHHVQHHPAVLAAVCSLAASLGLDVGMLTGALVQDVLKCNDKELRVLAEVKFHPGLKQAFDEAGISATEAGPYVGTPESVIAAVKKHGSPERLHYIIRTLAGGDLGCWLLHCAV